MGQGELLEKLSKVLEQDITSEVQMVYILTRIRKVLELQKIKSNYPILNFFCNWALHPEISDTNPISEFLQKIIENKIDADEFRKFDLFFKELEGFFEQFSLPKNSIFSNRGSLCDILGSIFSDTPLSIKSQPIKFIVTLSQTSNPSFHDDKNTDEPQYLYEISTRNK